MNNMSLGQSTGANCLPPVFSFPFLREGEERRGEREREREGRGKKSHCANTHAHEHNILKKDKPSF